MTRRLLFSTIILMMLAQACQNQKAMKVPPQDSSSEISFAPGPPALVYKTRADYSDKVAVMLNEDKTAVISYPHPRDIARPAGLPYPSALADGYFLDKQGVGPRHAFTRFTMDEYAALAQAPTPEELLESIVDKSPFLEMYHCGNISQYKDASVALNMLIEQGLKPCRVLLEK